MQHGGMKVEALENRPVLSPWVTEYWEAYQILSTSRRLHQGGIGPIPLSEIVAYLQAADVRDVDERLTYIKMIQALDLVYVSHINEEAKKKSDAKSKELRTKGRG